MADSSTGGFIAPTTSPVYDDALDDVFQGFVRSVTGIPGNYVRPRWQPDPPNVPNFNIDWAAVGVTAIPGDWDTHERPDPTLYGGKGGVVQSRDELISILISFYGPHSMANAQLFHACCHVQQNMNVLRDAANVNLISIGEALQVPALLQQKWLKRADVKGEFRRRVSRTFPIHSLLSAEVFIDTEVIQTTINISN